MASLMIDGQSVVFELGQTIMEAATAAGLYIPHLCHKPGYTPHGSCKLCSVQVNGRICSACTFPAAEGQQVISQSDVLKQDRTRITQMLFVEGNHFCPSCEKSGNCQLQAVAYELDMQDNHFPQFYPVRALDASHPDIVLDHNRCIFCQLCVRASQERDHKNVFAISGRGIHKHLIVNTDSGLLGDSDLTVDDAAAHVCPTGAILIRHTAYQHPIGQRVYDQKTLSQLALEQEHE